MKEYKLKVPKIDNIADKEVIEQVSSDLLKQLGEQVGTGYDLRYNKRHIEFENGVITYRPFGTQVIITIEDNASNT